MSAKSSSTWCSVKNLALLFCFLQAVIISSTILFSVMYFPEVLNNGNYPESSNTLILEQDTPKPVIVSKIKSVNSHFFSLFQYEKLELEKTYVDQSRMLDSEHGFGYEQNPDTADDENLPDWFRVKKEYCDGCFVIYGNRVISLKHVTINPKYGWGKVGGEKINDVINQSEEDEMFCIKPGFFELDTYRLNIDEDLIMDLYTLYKGLTAQKPVTSLAKGVKTEAVAVVTIRKEYANFYHTTMNLYDMFLIMVVFKIAPRDMQVVWFDAHPASNLDAMWEVLYGPPTRIGSIKLPTMYSTMIWNGFGAYSHINQHRLNDIPFLEEFRHFVLTRYKVQDEHSRRCLTSLKITIIWRRNYVSHPRNIEGHVSRKIANEDEVINAIKAADPTAEVIGTQIEELSMDMQLELITRTDILVGMHGAGLSHILYLPRTSGVIELFPSYVSVGNAHFRSMARWRRLPYLAWFNQDKSLDDGHKTNVPTDVVQDMIKTMRAALCKENKN